MKYFTFSEFTDSETARSLGIDNTMNAQQEAHVVELVDTILDPLREAWGAPLVVTSGFRCKALNEAVGGVATSAHLEGWAADIVPSANDKRGIDAFSAFVADWATEKNIAFDQILLEKSTYSRWVHIGVRNLKGEQRRQVKSINA